MKINERTILKKGCRFCEQEYLSLLTQIILECTLNALSAADSVIIPVQAQYLPAKGMTQLVQTISKVKKYINPDIKIDGMLLTLVDSRTNLAKSTVEALRANFGNQIRMYRTQIPIAVKAAETSSKGKSIYAYEPNSTVSKAYAEFTKEVLADGNGLRNADIVWMNI